MMQNGKCSTPKISECHKTGEIIGSGLAGSAYTGSYDTKESVAHGIAVLKGYGNEI